MHDGRTPSNEREREGMKYWALSVVGFFAVFFTTFFIARAVTKPLPPKNPIIQPKYEVPGAPKPNNAHPAGPAVDPFLAIKQPNIILPNPFPDDPGLAPTLVTAKFNDVDRDTI